MKMECCEDTPCNWYRSHERTRPEGGQKGRADRGSIYSDDFCFLLTNAGAALFGQVRRLEEDLANGDGWREQCTQCGNRKKGGSLIKCDNCTDVYHFQCIPNGTPRPKKGTSGWFCPNGACQAKRAEEEQMCLPC